MNKKAIYTEAAPEPIGSYSQAVQVGNTVYLSGQIPIVPKTGELVVGGIEVQVKQIFNNLRAICKAVQCDLQHIAKLNIYMVDLSHFAVVNEVMAQCFPRPFPARAVVEVAQLPKGADIEIEGVLIISDTV